MRFVQRARLDYGVALVLLAVVAAACGSAPPPPVADAPDSLRYVIYYNSNDVPLASIAATQYTHVITSFVRARIGDSGAVELMLPEKMTGQWEAVDELHRAGKRVLVSFGGGLAKADEYTALVGREKELATAIAAFVRDKNLDGVDVDFEASSMLHLSRADGVGDGRAFLIALSKALRAELPSPRYELTHAPQPPYLMHEWHGAPYLDVLKSAGDAIDWIAVQYYNNPSYDDPVAEKIVGAVQRPWATSYRALVRPQGPLGWSSRRVLVGKPVDSNDTGSGAISPADIRKQIIEPLCAAFGNDFGGLVGWQFAGDSDDHRDWNSDMPMALSAAACQKQATQ